MATILRYRTLKMYVSFQTTSKCKLIAAATSLSLLPRTSAGVNFPMLKFHVCAVNNRRRKTKEEKKIEKEMGYVRNIDYTSLRKKKPVVDVWRNMTVAELAAEMGKDTDTVFELMMYVDNTNEYTEPNSVIHNWNALLEIIQKGGMRPHIIACPRTVSEQKEDRDVFRRPPPDPSKLIKRPPVVTVMGHVDHGKTTLLDSLRHTSVVSGEFGGITQHIGAFSVQVPSGEITFLDTPGHAAFSAMRSRGAHCTDIVVLVVAADDGVMEQTVESINMARDANVPIIVAINKIDKPEADIERTKKMLMMQDIVVEDLGGDVQAVPISALKGMNLDNLTEAILVQAELSDIKGDPTGYVEGVVIESRQDVHRGILCTALIQRGTLRKGCILTAGKAWAKVRGMFDVHQRTVLEAPPSAPVELIGWRSMPYPGDIIIEVESEQRAHEVMRHREKKEADEKALHDLPEILRKAEEHRKEYKPKLEMRLRKGQLRVKKGPKQKEIQDDYTGPRLNVVIKGDVEGSLEAILDVLETYNDPLCRFDIVHYGIGHINVGDITVAKAFNAVIYNFNVGCLPDAKSAAHKENISIRPHNVIYRLVDDLKKEINSRLPSVVKEEVIGEAAVLELFLITDGKKKNVPVAGCRCIKGELKKATEYKVIRDGNVIHVGKLESMRHMKNEVTTIKKEQECGLRFEDTSILFKPGDIIQCFRYYNAKQEIKWDPF